MKQNSQKRFTKKDKYLEKLKEKNKKDDERSSTVIYKRIKILNITPEYRHNPKGPATLDTNTQIN